MTTLPECRILTGHTGKARIMWLFRNRIRISRFMPLLTALSASIKSLLIRTPQNTVVSKGCCSYIPESVNRSFVPEFRMFLRNNTEQTCSGSELKHKSEAGMLTENKGGLLSRCPFFPDFLRRRKGNVKGRIRKSRFGLLKLLNDQIRGVSP